MRYLVLALSLLALPALAANPSFGDFNTSQFSTTGNKVAMKVGALLTNINGNSITGALSSATISGTNVTGNLTNNTTGSAGSVTGTLTNALSLNSALQAQGVLTAFEGFGDYSTGVPPAGSITNGFGWFGAGTVSNGVLKTAVFNDGFTDTYLEITNGYYCRSLAISNKWKIVFIGVTASITPNGTSAINGCMTAIGMKSSVGPGYEGYIAGNCSNFFGFVDSAGNTNGQQWAYTAGAGFPYYLQNVDGGILVQVSSGVATNKGGAFSTHSIPVFGTQRRHPIMTVLHRAGTGTANIADRVFLYSGATSVPFDYDQKSMNNLISPSQTTAPLDALVNVSGPVTCTTSEANGNLDQVQVYWHNPTNALQIYSINVKAIY